MFFIFFKLFFITYYYYSYLHLSIYYFILSLVNLLYYPIYSFSYSQYLKDFLHLTFLIHKNSNPLYFSFIILESVTYSSLLYYFYLIFFYLKLNFFFILSLNVLILFISICLMFMFLIPYLQAYFYKYFFCLV
jgi:hypothetical protein